MKLQTAIFYPFLLLGAFPEIAMGASTQEIMKGLDKDADGSVSQKDFLSFFQSSEKAPSKRNLRKLEDGTSDACAPETSLEDLALTLKLWARSNGYNGASLFQKYDTNGDGNLDTDECIEMLVDMGCPRDEATAKDPRFGEFMDTNNDGNVDVDELTDIIMC